MATRSKAQKRGGNRPQRQARARTAKRSSLAAKTARARGTSSPKTSPQRRKTTKSSAAIKAIKRKRKVRRLRGAVGRVASRAVKTVVPKTVEVARKVTSRGQELAAEGGRLLADVAERATEGVKRGARKVKELAPLPF